MSLVQQQTNRRRGKVLVLGGWSPGPLEILANEFRDVDFFEPTIPMPPSGIRWCLNPFWFLLLATIFSVIPALLSTDSWISGSDALASWLFRAVLLVAVCFLLRFLVAGLVWFAIKDGVWTAGRAIRDFHPDVVLAFSWGGGVALWLLAARGWKGPTILLAPTMKAMACVSCCAMPKFLQPARAPVHVFHAEHDGFCPASQVQFFNSVGYNVHVCDDDHVLLRQRSVQEIAKCLRDMLASETSEGLDSDVLGAENMD